MVNLPKIKVLRMNPLPQCSKPRKLLSGQPKYAPGRRAQLQMQGLDPDCCLKSASISINGKAFCHDHAKEFSLIWLIENQGKNNG